MVYKFIVQLLFSIALIIFGGKLWAHPSWGIVSTSSGDIYFVDVLHNNGTLWKYQMGKEEPEPVFSGRFHAHALQIDQNDNLYVGLHIWVDGEIMGDGQNYLLKYDTKSGQLDTLAFSLTYEALFGGNVVYDQECENYYYAHDKQIHLANVHSMDAAPFSTHKFERISTMTFDRLGKLWITDSFHHGGTLYYLDKKGKLKKYADQLIPNNPSNPVFEDRRFQLLYGISFDPEQNPIMMDSASRSVYKVDKNGNKAILYTAPKDYFPAGVCFVGGKMVIMEVGFTSGKGHKGPRLVIETDDNFKTLEFDYD